MVTQLMNRFKYFDFWYFYNVNNMIYGCHLLKCFPHSSVGKESTCNTRDPGSIPGSGRSSGEGIASWVAKLVKNLLAMRETWVRSLGREDSLEKG